MPLRVPKVEDTRDLLDNVHTRLRAVALKSI